MASLPRKTEGLQELRKNKLLAVCNTAIEERAKAVDGWDKALQNCETLQTQLCHDRKRHLEEISSVTTQLESVTKELEYQKIKVRLPH